MDVDSKTFGLGTFSQLGSAPFPGMVIGDRVVDLRQTLGPEVTTLSLLEDWERSRASLLELRTDGPPAAHRFAELHPHPPVASSQIFAAGANYTRHVRQIMVTAFRSDPDEARSTQELTVAAEEIVRERAESGTPFVFCAPTLSLSGAEDDIVLWGPGTQHDWELELAVVIGRRASNVGVEDAMSHVAGYTICNDISTRDMITRPGFPMTDFLRTKCRPTFFPAGPYIVPAEFVPDYRQLRITLSVNGEIMQDESVDDIIYGVEELVAYTSAVLELAPGDLLLTGSPAGNAGHHGDRWLVPGDRIEGTITGLGTQRNRCVADPRA